MPFEIDSCPIRGNRVIAKRFIPKGELRIKMDSGGLIPIEDMQDHYYALQVSETHFIGTKEADMDDPTCFLNHSCSPNLAFENGELTLINIRDINDGDELTWDYSASIDDDVFEMKCNCKSPECRGVIRSFGDLDDDIKRKLLPHALSYIQKRYKNLINI
jgi:SET domain-containing protein